MYLVKNLYPENIHKDDLIAFLEKQDKITNYFLIIHDKDIKSDGTVKKPHYHLLIDSKSASHHLKNDLTTAFLPLFTEKSQCILEIVRNVKSQARYLLHLDNLEKAQYNVDDVITNDIEMYQDLITIQIKEREGDNMLEMLLNEIEVNSNFDTRHIEIYCLNFFRKHGRLSYYVSHKRNIIDMCIDALRFKRDMTITSEEYF